MAENISPQQIQQAAKAGFDRLKVYRNSRAEFIKTYAGQYYQKKYGLTGDQPLNLLFNAVRIMVPNLVMRNPKFEISTNFAEHKMYAELLSRGVNFVGEQTKLKSLLRAWIVDALFGFGIMKTTLNSSQHTVTIDDLEIDPGQVCSDNVSIDNFTFDPTCTKHLFKDATFLGHASIIPRQQLLDAKGYDHDLINKIPTIDSYLKQKDSKEISKGNFGNDYASWRQLIRVVELYIPRANALVTIPDPRIITFDKFIRTVEYYGPDSGPYTFLSFTPPVPDNPIPIAPVSMWYDLHNSTNTMFKKLLDQALRQKDIVVYNPAEADAAQDMLEAKDGEAIATSDPNGVDVKSFGGQKQSNETMVNSLQTWFSLMAGNVEQLGGTSSDAATATQAEMLQANANVTIEDSRDIIYDGTSNIGRNMAWYLHNDPLIDIPVPYRLNDEEEVTIHLTPEDRRGDFLEYTFNTKAKSMSRLDPVIKTQRVLEFATNVIPAAANAAQICMQMGTPFNFPKYVTKIAEEMGLEDFVSEFFEDPEFQQKMQIMMMLGPKGQQKKPNKQMSNAGTTQNGGAPMQQNINSQTQQTNQNRQMGAAESQAARL